MISSLLYVCCGGLLICSTLADVNLDKKVAGSKLNFVPKYSRLLKNAHELKRLKASPSVGTVYYYKTDSNKWISDFLGKYDKSAGFLNAYGLPLGLVDCSSPASDLQEECSKASDESVYTYKNGNLLLALEVATMFDVDSIMSNVLILALVDEIEVVQSMTARQQLEHDYAGQKDVVFAYHSAIGTYEHRVYMEIAYAYHDKYKFAMTTEPLATTDLQDADLLTDSTVCSMWVMYCQDRYDVATGCRSVNYRGRLNLLDMAAFFKQLSWPKVVYRTKDSREVHPCELQDDVGCVVISHSPATKDQTDRVINSLQYDLHGMVGLVVQHIDGADGATDPQVVIQKPGGTNVNVEGNFDLDVLEGLIAFHLLPELDDKPEDTLRTHAEDTTESRASKIDDMVVQVAFQQRQPITNIPDIPALTDKTFPTTTRNNKLTVVLFYLQFDAQGMVFLNPYQEAGRKLASLKGGDSSAHPLARMNCFDWTDVCEKENISTYPVVYIYRQGGQREQYRGALDTDALVRTVMLLEAEQPLMLSSSEEVGDFLKGQLPTPTYRDTDNLVLLKLTSSQREMEAYKAVVKALETQMLFAMVGSDVETSFLPNGGVLHKRPKDSAQPMEVMTENLDAASIVNFLQRGQFSLFPELTFRNFPALFARKKPLGILFYEPSVPSAVDVHQSIVGLLQSGTEQDLTFCKMTVGEANPDAKPLLMNYSQTEELPAFTIVNHAKGEVYVLQDREMTPSALVPWMQAVKEGQVVPSKMLERGEWKPTSQHYDFLALMDREKKQQERKRLTSSADNPELLLESEVEQQQDAGTRSSLLELQQSRLYSSKDRRMNLPFPGSRQGNPGKTTSTHAAKHTEL
ncbi:hypothetical protein ACOMHN_042655 [Nucella lapillus]